MALIKKILPLFIIVLCAACSGQQGEGESLDELVVGFVPSEEAERMVDNLQPVTNYLEQELGIPVKIYRGNDYTAIIEGMRGEKVDVGIFGPFSYVLADAEAGAQALVVPSKRSGTPATYQSLLITHANSGIERLEELAAHQQQYTLSFSDPASTSGHLVPRGQLQSMGLKPETHFREILFSGNHPATILAVANEKVDVAGCSYTVFRKMIERGMLQADQVKILWKSRPLPVDLVTVRSGLSDSLKTRLLDIYTRLADEVPASANYFYEEWNDSSLVFLPVHDTLYNEIRRLSASLEDSY